MAIHNRLLLLNPGVLMLAVLATIFSFFCFQHQIRVMEHPCKCADAVAYFEIGKQYTEVGLFQGNPWSNLRSFGYPLFLAGTILVSKLSGLNPYIVVFVSQLTLYALASYIFARNMLPFVGPRGSKLLLLAMLGNIFIYPYLVLPLTDGMSVILLVIQVAILLRVCRPAKQRPKGLELFLLIFLLGALYGFSVMVRPASIYYLSLIFVGLLYFVFSSTTNRAGTIGLLVVVAASGFALLVTPQVMINKSLYNKMSFLPVYQLGEFQVEAGKNMLKFSADFARPNPPIGFSYRNPWHVKAEPGLRWYLNNPYEGAVTMGLHVFAAFDFNSLFCYRYGLTSPYQPALFALCHFVVFWGISGFFSLIVRYVRVAVAKENESRNFLLLIALFYAALFGGWLVIHATVAVENRFALPVISMAIPLAMWRFVTVVRRAPGVSYRVLSMILFFVYLLLAWKVSQYINSTGPIGS